jgi:hypothetical protein
VQRGEAFDLHAWGGVGGQVQALERCRERRQVAADQRDRALEVFGDGLGSAPMAMAVVMNVVTDLRGGVCA